MKNLVNSSYFRIILLVLVVATIGLLLKKYSSTRDNFNVTTSSTSSTSSTFTGDYSDEPCEKILEQGSVSKYGYDSADVDYTSKLSSCRRQNTTLTEAQKKEKCMGCTIRKENNVITGCKKTDTNGTTIGCTGFTTFRCGVCDQYYKDKVWNPDDPDEQVRECNKERVGGEDTPNDGCNTITTTATTSSSSSATGNNNTTTTATGNNNTTTTATGNNNTTTTATGNNNTTTTATGNNNTTTTATGNNNTTPTSTSATTSASTSATTSASTSATSAPAPSSTTTPAVSGFSQSLINFKNVLNQKLGGDTMSISSNNVNSTSDIVNRLEQLLQESTIEEVNSFKNFSYNNPVSTPLPLDPGFVPLTGGNTLAGYSNYQCFL